MAHRVLRTPIWAALWAAVAAGPAACPAAETRGPLVWEAENCTSRLPPLIVEPADGASGGACLTVPEGLGSAGGEARYRLQVPAAGRYCPWFRILSDFMWDGWGRLRVDGVFAGPWIMGFSGPDWRWTRGLWNHPGVSGEPDLELAAGIRTVALGAPGGDADGIARRYGKLDKILLSPDATYVPADDDALATGVTPGLVLPQANPVPLIAWEAEDLAIGGDAATAREMESAHAGRVLESVGGPTDPAGYRVSVPRAGAYYLWARIWFTSLRVPRPSPSVRVRLVDAESTLAAHRGWGPEYFAWVREVTVAPHFPFHGVAEPVALELPAGESTLVVSALGAGTALDQFALVDDPAWVPGADGRSPIEMTTGPPQ